MKTLITIMSTILPFIVPFSVDAQCPENLYINSQAELDAFLDNFPNCTEFPGVIRIDPTSGEQVNDLSPLQNITTIGGYLVIRYTNLTTLEGLENLTSVGGLFSLYENDHLTTLEDIPSLNSVGILDIQDNDILVQANLPNLSSTGSIFIGNNDALTSFNLENITSATGNVTFIYNSVLNSLQGLSNLTTIGNILTIGYNDQLNSLQGLETLTGIGNYLNIENNPNLISLDLENLSSIGGALQISNNDALNNLAGIGTINPQTITNLQITGNDNLSVCGINNICTYLTFDPTNKPRTISDNAPGCTTEIEVKSSCLYECPVNIVFNTQAQVNEFGQTYGHCTVISGNILIKGAGITDLTPLLNITSIGGFLRIQNCPNLANLNGLKNLESVGGTLELSGNEDLNSLEALESITIVEENLNINNNNILANLNGLEGIESVGGYVSISYNNQLNSLSGLDNLATIEKYLIISFNNSLENLTELGSLQSIGEYLSINDNPALTSLQGLEGIESLGGRLTIANNAVLTSLSQLGSITTIGGEIQVFNNTILSSLNGLHNIDPTTITNLQVTDNNNLAICGLSNICTYLANGGPSTISGNTTSCEDLMAVQLSCLAGEIIVTSVESIQDITVKCPTIAEDLDLPSTVVVTYSDNAMGNVAVTWDLMPFQSTVGTYHLTGTLALTRKKNPNDLAAQITVHVEDNLAPVPDQQTLVDITASCQVSEEDVTPPTASDLCTQGSITATTDFAFPTAVSGTITWTFEDDAGNTTTQHQQVIISNASTPVIECPENHIVSCDTIVTFDLPIVTNGCGTTGFIQTDGTGLTSGSDFPVGNTNLTYQTIGGLNTASCSIVVEVLPPLEIQHIYGVRNGDTLHLDDCIPLPVSKDNLDLGPHQHGSSVIMHNYYRDLPPNPEFGLWKMNLHTYRVTDQCGNIENFENYVALYDLEPPEFRNFPGDTIIDAPTDLPPVPDDVEILDICRFDVRDTVFTFPVIDPDDQDTLAFVRHWVAEDEVGNQTFRDQLIRIGSAQEPDLNTITTHLVTEEDLTGERFPHTAGTDGIPVILYRQNMPAGAFTVQDTLVSGNWMGRRGNVFFTSLQPGSYRIKIQLPVGYTAIHPDSLVNETGWSDTLMISGDSVLQLGTILLIPGVVSDNLAVQPILKNPVSPENQQYIPVTLYPNPTSGRINIMTAAKSNLNYTIFNHLGQHILQGIAHNGSEVDLGKRADGIYFIRFENRENISETRRILLFRGR